MSSTTLCDNREAVPLAVYLDSILSDEKLETFYADKMAAWDRDFLGRLADRQQRFALLEGEAGSGKITYLTNPIQPVGAQLVPSP